VSRRARCPSAAASARRCATSPGCCARSRTPPPASEGWEERTREAFLAGYFETADSSLLPSGQEAINKLLSVFELEKAVYELRYELNNRPDWVAIPVAGIVRLLDAGEPR
jgi:predicted trehalose synthase